jgi:hypothetical protein
MLRLLLLTVLALFATVAAAQAGSTDFANPKQGGNRLDYCFSWQKGCGQQAADAWCVSKGFENASDFSKAKGIGADTPTRTIGDNSVCDKAGCDGFKSISCYKQANDSIFVAPKVEGVRVDWCLNWAKDCGKPAADAFCQSKGHVAAFKFSKAVGVGPTRVLGTGQMCDDKTCDGFTSLSCTD